MPPSRSGAAPYYILLSNSATQIKILELTLRGETDLAKSLPGNKKGA
jgi:hypothetical protein